MNIKHILIVSGYLNLVKSFYQNDLPGSKHLDVYVEVLHNITMYIENSIKNHLEDPFFPDALVGKFPLSIIQMNVDRVRQRIIWVDGETDRKLREIQNSLFDINAFYEANLTVDYTSDAVTAIQILTMFLKDNLWKSAMPSFYKFKIKPLEADDNYKHNVSSYEEYFKHHEDIQGHLQKLSVACMLDVMTNQEKDVFGKCRMDFRCKKYMLTTKFLYGANLSAWILLLIHLRFSKSCYIISPKRDKEIVQNLCTLAYNEALLIKENKYGLYDEMMFKATLCGILGYHQFLNRDWLEVGINLRSKEGCLKMTEDKYEKRLNATLRTQQRKCIGSEQAAATATVSAAIRNLFELQPGQRKSFKNYFDAMKIHLKFLKSQVHEQQDFLTIFSIFLSRVNLKYMLDNWNPKLGNLYRNRTERAYKTCVDLQKKMSEKRIDLGKQLKIISETQWLQKVEKMRERTPNKIPKSTYLLEDIYDKNIEDSRCFSDLLAMPVAGGEFNEPCQVTPDCIQALSLYSENTESQMNKLLMLMFAKYGRNCYLTTPAGDEQTSVDICTQAFKKADLKSDLSRFAGYCTFNGHRELFQENWMSNFLKKNPDSHCVLDQQTLKQRSCSTSEEDRPCDSITTVYFASTLSLAIRFISELYYQNHRFAITSTNAMRETASTTDITGITMQYNATTL